MKRKKLTASLIVLISAGVFLFTYNTVKSCGPCLMPDDYYSVFNKSVFDLPDLKPFFLSEYIFADQDETGANLSAVNNMKDWLNYLDNSPAIDHIENVIYKTPLEELKTAKEYIDAGKPVALSKELKNNTMIRYLKDIKGTEIIDYIIFAKECEPEITYQNQWEEVKRNYSLMASLSEKGLGLYANAKSDFIKDRYAFQLIRLAHYSNQYQKTVELFDRFFSSGGKNKMIYYWSLAHKAGAVSSLNKKAEANLLFAQVFDSCESRRKQCMLSINLNSDSLYKATLAICKQPREKMLIYLIAGYKNADYSRDALNKIYEIDPASPYVELLLSREIHRAEREILPSREIWGGYKYYLEPREMQNLNSGIELFNITAKIAKEKRTRKPWLWNFAAGYLATLLNKNDESKDFYLEAKKMCPKENLSYIRRIQVAETISDIKSVNRIDNSNEDEIAVKLNWLKNISTAENVNSKDALVYVMNLLAKKYIAQKDTLKTHLCLGIRIENIDVYYTENQLNVFGYDIKSDYSNEPIDELLKILYENEKRHGWIKEKTDRKFSAMENFLLENYSFSYRDLNNIKAKWFIARGRFEEALAMLEKGYFISKDYDHSDKLWADPFVIHTVDCHDCDYAAVSTNRYTLASFCKKMIELKKLASQDKAKSAEYYYQLANGLYNKSYYGNAWIASAFTRHTGPWGYYLGFHYEFYDCSEAQSYYLKAAQSTSNREFAAKCIYMAAKCEQNSYYSSPAFTSNEEPTPLAYRTNFKKLKEEFNDTKYYKEILGECKYFSEYAGKY